MNPLALYNLPQGLIKRLFFFNIIGGDLAPSLIEGREKILSTKF